MNPVFIKRNVLVPQSYESKHRISCVCSLLASLAIGLSCTFPALAQPTNPPKERKEFRLTSPRKKQFETFVNLSRMEDVCKFSADIKSKDATLEGIVAQVKKLFPSPVAVEVRSAKPVRLSFDLQETAIGGVLSSAGALAGCKLWLLGDHLLLAPEDKLEPVEKEAVDNQLGGEWSRNVVAGGSGWSSMAQGRHELLSSMAEAFDFERVNNPAKPLGDAKTTSANPASLTMRFEDLSPDGQAIIRQLVEWEMASARVQNPLVIPVFLSPDTQIIFDDSKKESINLDIKNAPDSDSKPSSVGWVYSR